MVSGISRGMRALLHMSQDRRITSYPERASSTAVPGDAAEASAPTSRRILTLVPGVAACLVGAILAWVGASVLPGVSALLIAIILGATWRNLIPIPTVLVQGVRFSSKKLLRLGIILLGLQLSLSSILNLGFGVLLVVVVSVAVTFFATLWVGRLMGVSLAQRLLVASGVSICGASAVAATEGAIKSKEEEVATAIALVVLFGTLMIPLVPFLGGLLDMPEEMLGMWIGASTHEVAQVVAAGGAVGSGALAVAVTVKLARVITLAPIIAGISIFMRRRGADGEGKKPPIIPLFVLGFIGAMLLRTLDFLPEGLLSALELMQVLLLAAAMFALGMGVHIPSLFRVGAKPVILGVVSTTVILSTSLVGASIFGAS